MIPSNIPILYIIQDNIYYYVISSKISQFVIHVFMTFHDYIPILWPQHFFFYQTDQQIWPFFNVTGRRMEATSRNSLARNSTPNRAFGMVAIPWDNNEVLEGVKSWNLWYTSFLDDHGYLSLASPSIPWSWNIERTSSIFMRYLFIATLEKIRGWWQKSDVTMNCDNSFLEF